MVVLMASYELKCIDKGCANEAVDTVTAEPFTNGGTKCPDCGRARLVRPVGKSN